MDDHHNHENVLLGTDKEKKKFEICILKRKYKHDNTFLVSCLSDEFYESKEVLVRISLMPIRHPRAKTVFIDLHIENLQLFYALKERMHSHTLPNV